MSKKLSKKSEEYGHRIRIIRLMPPRELDIRIDNPIEGVRFGEYRILFNQEWIEADDQDSRFIARAENDDALAKHAREVGQLAGRPFYSLYGVYSEIANKGGHSLVGLDECIGDYKTFDKLLTVLEGIGLIAEEDHANLLEIAKDMELVR